MSDRHRHYLRDRGLADDTPPAQPQVVPFQIDPATGAILTETAPPLEPPDDRGDRLRVLELLAGHPGFTDPHQTLRVARAYLAFLTNTEPKQTMFTDEDD